MDTGTRGELLTHLAEAAGSVTIAHPTRVGIDGPPAAGKTTLADELAAVLRSQGREVIRATIEDFLTPRSRRWRRGEYSAEGCWHDSTDLGALQRVLLDPLGPGGDRRYQRAVYDKAADTARSEPGTTAAACTVLVFDGVFLLRPELIDRWGPAHPRIRPVRDGDGALPDAGPDPVQVRGRGRAALPQPLAPLSAVLLRHGPPGRARRHPRAQRRPPAPGMAGQDTLMSYTRSGNHSPGGQNGGRAANDSAESSPGRTLPDAALRSLCREGGGSAVSMAVRFPAAVDTIVVGAGTAGAVLAGRLAAGSAERTLLLEPGPDYGPAGSGRWPPDLLDATRSRNGPTTGGMRASPPGR